MAIFHFVEHSFDINLINKCKTHLESKSIKQINAYLLDLCKLDAPLNNFKVTIYNEKNNKKIQYFSEENKNKEQIFNSYEKENSSSRADDAEKYLSD